MIKVSVIIPVFNVEKYLKECLNSLINQTLNDIEIICIDDCSTDNSLKILQEYAKKDDRIKVFEQKENKGQGVARNFGITLAQGEFITFVNPDDYIETTMYEKMYAQAKTLNSDVVMCDIQKYFEKTNKLEATKSFRNYKNIYKSELANLRPKTNLEKAEISKLILISPNYSWNKVYKRDFILKNNIKFSNTRTYQDVVFGLSALIFAKRISYIDEHLYIYRIRETSSLRNNKMILQAFCQTLDDIQEISVKNNLYEKFENHLKYFIIANLKNIYNRGFDVDKNFVENLKYLNSKEKSYLKKKFGFEFSFKQFLKNLIKQVFSVTKSKDKSHKIITVLGIKIKFRLKNK